MAIGLVKALVFLLIVVVVEDKKAKSKQLKANSQKPRANSQKQTTENLVKNEHSNHKRKMKILVIENHEPSREHLQVLLTKEGYDVAVASNGKEGLEAHNKHKPDLIISDIRMPYIDGLSVLRQLRKEASDVFFVIITAHGNEKSAAQAIKHGVHDYLIKPFENKELLRVVSKCANVLQSRHFAKASGGNDIFKFIRTQFSTDYNYIPKIVGRLVSQISVNIDSDKKSKIEMGLHELITNSIEHGNLEITSLEKTEAYKSFAFEKLCKQRMKNKKLADRKVTVDYHQKKDVLIWKITDEGNGFNWEEILDPTDESHLLEPTGRGIFFTKYYFDYIRYIGKGNIVKVKKFL